MPIKHLKAFLEKIDYRRDQLLFPLIKNYWPRVITPNHLTVFRIFVGVILAFFLFGGYTEKTVIIPLFCLGLLSDLFDGSVARALNKKTFIGVIIDPFADRVLIIPITVYVLIGQYIWLMLFLISAEVLTALFSIFRNTKESMIESNIFSKTKMVVQSFAFGIILVNFPVGPSHFSVSLLLFSIIFWTLGFISKLFNNNQNA